MQVNNSLRVLLIQLQVEKHFGDSFSVFFCDWFLTILFLSFFVIEGFADFVWIGREPTNNVSTLIFFQIFFDVGKFHFHGSTCSLRSIPNPLQWSIQD